MIRIAAVHRCHISAHVGQREFDPVRIDDRRTKIACPFNVERVVGRWMYIRQRVAHTVSEKANACNIYVLHVKDIRSLRNYTDAYIYKYNIILHNIQ